MLEKVSRKSRAVGIERFVQSTTLIYGPPKAGKTTFASTFPDVLLVELEPGGADYVECDVVEVNSLQELRALYSELKALKPEELKWKVIALDTIDVISSYFEREIALEYGKTILAGPSTAFGAEYARHRAEVMAVLRAFQALPSGLLLIAHARFDEKKTTLNLPGRYLSLDVMAMASNILYLGLTEEGQREVVVSPSPALEAGSRDPVLASISRFPPDFKILAKLYEEELVRLGWVPKEEEKPKEPEKSGEIVRVKIKKEVSDVQTEGLA